MNAYAQADLDRAAAAVATLMPDAAAWVLAGGSAAEYHVARRGGMTVARELGDLDFLVASFDAVDRATVGALELRHVHPGDPPGKTLLQGVHAPTRLRIDVFRAYGREIERAESAAIFGTILPVVSFADALARLARLCWQVVSGEQLEAKFARDFMRLLDLQGDEAMDATWAEHRKNGMPKQFVDAAREIVASLAVSGDALTTRVYTIDPDEVCPRCHDTAALRRAPAARMLELLGYC